MSETVGNSDRLGKVLTSVIKAGIARQSKYTPCKEHEHFRSGCNECRAANNIKPVEQ